MKVKQLIKFLQSEDPDRTILISSDSEGNSYSIFSEFTRSAYRKDGYEIEIGLEKLTPELEEKGYSEEDVLKKGKPALIFYP